MRLWEYRKRFPLRFHARRLLILTSALIFAGPALAQFPSKPIRVVVPFPAGSATDTFTRVLSGSVSAAIGQPLIVDNKAGADGAIAASEVERAAPDGYTLLMATNSPMSAVPAMKKNPPYDPVADFSPITDIGRYTLFIVVHPTVPAKTIAELIQFARSNPGKVNYATGNTASIVTMALFSSLARVEMVHIPYKGEPQAMIDLIGGRVQLMLATAGTSVSPVRDGRLRALATTLTKRSPLLPEVPTIAEAGVPELSSVIGWAGLFGPANIPREIVDRLNREFVAAMGRADVQASMEKQAFVLSPSTPEKLGALVKQQMESYRNILRAAGVQPN